MSDPIAAFRRALPPKVAHATLRLVEREEERLTVRRDDVEPPQRIHDVGAMVTVHVDEGDAAGVGYAATADLSEAGLKAALDRATTWASDVAQRSAVPATAWRASRQLDGSASWATAASRPGVTAPLAEKLDVLRPACAALAGGSEPVDRWSSLWSSTIRTTLASADDAVEQVVHLLTPGLGVTVSKGPDVQTRSMGHRGRSIQGGLEHIEQTGLTTLAPTLLDEALALLAAPDCPTGTLDVVLAPDQMVLQIHESIGHPLELDRLLGDERNYAGRTFVTPEMYGAYRYGSELLNVTFHPGLEHELATAAFDDDGHRAERTWLIKAGVLLAGIGGRLSQERSGLPGTASSRASSWNRPPIDRMGNINLEPGGSSVEELIAGVEDGVWMETNTSWSIDSSREKFQFGCELGRRIRGGALAEVVKKPGYRGVSSSFWRSLDGVGDASTFEVLGTPFCGKGEPNQMVRVGHASPPCRFRGVEVFGGE